MKEWESLDDVLDFAIDQEQAAADFYTKLSESARHASMRDVLQSFAAEELRHKQKLVAIKEQGATILLIEQNAAESLKISHRGYVIETGLVSISGNTKQLIENEAVKKAYMSM